MQHIQANIQEMISALRILASVGFKAPFLILKVGCARPALTSAGTTLFKRLPTLQLRKHRPEQARELIQFTTVSGQPGSIRSLEL